MKRARFALGQSALMFMGSVLGVTAQDLSEVCPGSEGGTGALYGLVSDPDAGMVLPGATVVVAWQEGGSTARAEAVAGLDGSFTVCHLPLDTELTVQSRFATMAGTAIRMSLAEPITRQDVPLSMTGGGGGEKDDRIWMCLAGGESTINLQNSRILRCEPQWQPLEKCPKVELGTVNATATGSGSGMMREMLEQIVADTRRLGANALLNVSGGRGSMRATAVKIDVDPSTC